MTSRPEAPAGRLTITVVIWRALLAGAAWGAIAGLVVCVPATWMDWSANPAGLFHGPAGTKWPIVRETAWSWFWPVAFLVAPTVALTKAWSLRRGRTSPPSD